MIVINNRFSFVGTFICQYSLIATIWKLVLILLQVQWSFAFAYIEITIQVLFSLYATSLMYVVFLAVNDEEE